MKPRRQNRRHGFTILEVLTASFILMLMVGGAMTAFVQGLKIWEQERIKSELNLDLELAMEWIRTDLRLSSVGVGLMSFYPSDDTEYTAISMPLSIDTDGDGLLDRGSDDKIEWNQTVIYHVRAGTPHQLLRTVYSPRYSNAAPSQIYQQLDDVANSSNSADLVNAALINENVSSKIIFENLVNLKFRPPYATYDCYSPTREKGMTYNWGSVVLSNGIHQLTFTVEGRNTNNTTGYKIEIDKITLSASASDREGEIVLPMDTHPAAPYFEYSAVGGTVSAVDRSSVGSSWSGNCALMFNAAGTGSIITLDIYNDLWCDANFTRGQHYNDCSIKYDDSFVSSAPNIPDVVASMDKGTAWTASSCGEDTIATYSSLTTITNIIYGGTNNEDMTIILNGCWAKLYFERATNCSLVITNARIIDPVTSGVANVTFNGGDNYVVMTNDGPVVTNSDWVPMWEINKGQNYRVRFDIAPTGYDNDLDMFVGESIPSAIKFYENTGSIDSPNFPSGVQKWQGIEVVGSGGLAPAFGDLDADGDYDLIVGIKRAGASPPYFQFYRNIGTSKDPNMTNEAFALTNTVSYNSTPVLVDIDGDGDLDFFTGMENGDFTFSLNAGSASSPTWSTPIKLKDVLSVDLDVGDYSAPEFADIDGDGDLDMFSGCDNKYLWLWRNTGSATVQAFTYVTNRYANLTNDSTRCIPRFVDIDNDLDLDLFVGALDGKVCFYENTGSAASAVWAAPQKNYVSVSGRAAPDFVNIDADINGAACWRNTNGLPLSYENGVASDKLVALSSIEVGYPKQATFRSRVFDTQTAAPNFNELNWTQVEEDHPEGDIDIRIRASDRYDMSDMMISDWLGDGGFGTNKYFNSNTGNSLANLPKKRYVQYEVKFGCNNDSPYDKVWAHTNYAKCKLRDVTIDWPGPTGLVDLQVDFGKGPDCGIVGATVDGQAFMKGVELEMEIFKRGRTGTNIVSGKLEIRPLNTGR